MCARKLHLTEFVTTGFQLRQHSTALQQLESFLPHLGNLSREMTEQVESLGSFVVEQAESSRAVAESESTKLEPRLKGSRLEAQLKQSRVPMK